MLAMLPPPHAMLPDYSLPATSVFACISFRHSLMIS